jgi:predicted phosphodiesterase
LPFVSPEACVLRIQLASDLHHEFATGGSAWGLPIDQSTSADVLVLAGDIHHRERGIELYKNFPVPVVYVHGTHELYGSDLGDVEQELRQTSAGTSVTYLERDELIVAGTRILGCCLWVDYRLGPGSQRHTMYEAGRFLNEHRLITIRGKLFTPENALAEHLRSKRWLEARLGEPFRGKTVVVTHFAPSSVSLPAYFRGDPLNPTCASDLSRLVQKADLWLHGHIHSSSYNYVGNSLIVCNPRGYPAMNNRRSETKSENAGFVPRFTVEI